MKTVAVVPMKALREAKSRLAGVLSPEERVTLSRDMLDHVLWAISESGAVDAVAVISPEVDRLHLPLWVTRIQQSREGLNELLEQGREWAISEGAGALMVVFADLPLLSPDDVAHLADLGRSYGTVALAPDRHGQGTNVMLAHPPSLVRFAYGPGSFSKHRVAAWEVATSVEIYSSAGTAFDVDTPDDLHRLGIGHRIRESTA